MFRKYTNISSFISNTLSVYFKNLQSWRCKIILLTYRVKLNQQVKALNGCRLSMTSRLVYAIHSHHQMTFPMAAHLLTVHHHQYHQIPTIIVHSMNQNHDMNLLVLVPEGARVRFQKKKKNEWTNLNYSLLSVMAKNNFFFFFCQPFLFRNAFRWMIDINYT